MQVSPKDQQISVTTAETGFLRDNHVLLDILDIIKNDRIWLFKLHEMLKYYSDSSY